MPDELKPCPFCGGSPVEARVSWGYYVRCRACIATGGAENSPQKARDKWNCRAPKPEQTEAQGDLVWLKEAISGPEHPYKLNAYEAALYRTVIRLAEKED